MKKILLHACCAPCAAFPLTTMSDELVTVYFYNPNIDDKEEYLLRFAELSRYLEKQNITLIEGEYDTERWLDQVGPHAALGERSYRCEICFRIRLEEAFKTAVKNGFDAVGTVLTVSPHKDADLINRIGKEFSGRFGIDFIESDFKQNGGFQKGVIISKEQQFYRQNYCGCSFSKAESELRRKKNG